MIAEEILDVTILEPRRKHPTIFEKFDSLVSGESFIIHNDHDPKPLYYQLLGERGNIFSWEYLEDGPSIWQVRIGKTIAKKETIGDIVASDFRKAEVFKKFGIDFCCGGKKTLDEVCQQKNVDKEVLISALNIVNNQSTQSSLPNVDNWELDFLIDYIINIHHKYVKNNIPALYEYTQKIARVHGANHPETVAIAMHFVNVANEMQEHLKKEEEILFPYIKKLVAMKNGEAVIETSPFGTIDSPIRMMEIEHEAAGNELAKINELSNGYEIPADACNTYQVAYAKLKEFEDDLHCHVHLENNVLFIKAKALEKQLLNY